MGFLSLMYSLNVLVPIHLKYNTKKNKSKKTTLVSIDTLNMLINALFLALFLDFIEKRAKISIKWAITLDVNMGNKVYLDRTESMDFTVALLRITYPRFLGKT